VHDGSGDWLEAGVGSTGRTAYYNRMGDSVQDLRGGLLSEAWAEQTTKGICLDLASFVRQGDFSLKMAFPSPVRNCYRGSNVAQG
jgi:hypothetical protein